MRNGEGSGPAGGKGMADVNTVPAMHWWHTWTSWGEPEMITGTRLPELGAESMVAGDRVIAWARWRQLRRCAVCNAVSARYVMSA
jgi:hypothetical protein